MTVIDFFASEDQEHWLQQIRKSEWNAAQYLYTLLKDGTFFDAVGDESTVLLLVEGEELAAFCSLAEKDDIQPTVLGPWIGFVYTFPQYRGRRCQGQLLEEAKNRARRRGAKKLFVSTNETGLYEKYGFSFLQMMDDIRGTPSRVYSLPI